MTGGKILLTGARWRNSRSSPRAAPATAGSFNMTGGTFNFTAGQVTGNTAIVPTAPIALVGATMNVSAGTLNTTAGEFGITNGATLNLSGGVMNASTVTLNSSAFNFTGGTLHATTFNGNLMNNWRHTRTGTSPGTLTVNGNYTQNSGALEIELGGTSAGQFDKLNVTGNATLGGLLDVNLFNSFAPTFGQSWEIIDVAGHSWRYLRRSRRGCAVCQLWRHAVDHQLRRRRWQRCVHQHTRWPSRRLRFRRRRRWP